MERVHYNDGKELSVTIKDKTLRCIRTKRGKFAKKADVVWFAKCMAALMHIELGQIMVECFRRNGRQELARVAEYYKPSGKRYYPKRYSGSTA